MPDAADGPPALVIDEKARPPPAPMLRAPFMRWFIMAAAGKLEFICRSERLWTFIPAGCVASLADIPAPTGLNIGNDEGAAGPTRPGPAVVPAGPPAPAPYPALDDRDSADM